MNFQELSLSSQLMYVAMYETWKLLKALLREVEKQHEEERDLVRNVNAVDGDLDTVPDEEMLRLTVNCLANNTDLRQQQQLYHHSALEVVAADRETTAVSAAATGCGQGWPPAEELPDFVPAHAPHPNHERNQPDLIGCERGGRDQTDSWAEDSGQLVQGERRRRREGGVFRVDRRWLSQDKAAMNRPEGEDACDGRFYAVRGGGGRTLSERRTVELEDDGETPIRRHSFSGRPAAWQHVQRMREKEEEEEILEGWGACGSQLARMAQKRRTSGLVSGCHASWRASTPLTAALTTKASVGGRRRHSVPGGGDAQSLLSDVCVFVTIAGAYYCLKKIKAALF